MTSRHLLALLIPPLCLAGCGEEVENIQAKADSSARMLENKAVELEAEAANGVDAAIAPLDAEANAFLDHAGNAAIVSDNVAENAAR